jgi:hypothetical protein
MVPAFESVMNIVPAEFTSISIPVMRLITDVPAGSPHLLMNLPSFVNACMRWLPVSNLTNTGCLDNKCYHFRSPPIIIKNENKYHVKNTRTLRNAC